MLRGRVSAVTTEEKGLSSKIDTFFNNAKNHQTTTTTTMQNDDDDLDEEEGEEGDFGEWIEDEESLMEISEQRKTKCLFSQRVYSNAHEALTRAATDFGFDLRRVVSLNKKNTFIKSKEEEEEGEKPSRSGREEEEDASFGEKPLRSLRETSSRNRETRGRGTREGRDASRRRRAPATSEDADSGFREIQRVRRFANGKRRRVGDADVVARGG